MKVRVEDKSTHGINMRNNVIIGQKKGDEEESIMELGARNEQIKHQLHQQEYKYN